jgi:UDP-N-acetylmuramoyl-tripeptide--D-alanyl-D-alanine ligase
MFSPSLLTEIESLKILNKLPTDYLNVVTDSRKVSSGDFFVALSGENFNGNEFAEQALKSGAIVIMVADDRDWSELAGQYKNSCIVVVKDTLASLQELAKARINKWDQDGEKIRLGITGSNGKTTTKEMMTHLLTSLFPGKICATKGNFNNHIGVPLTLLSIKDDDELLICEMGTNHPGEIKFLCDIAEPNHGLITNIGASHLEFLGSEQGVFEEKSSLYHEIIKAEKKKGFFIINGTDDFLKTLQQTERTKFCSDENFKLFPGGVELCWQNFETKIENTLIRESYNWINMVNCLVCCLSIFPEKSSELFKAAATYNPPNNNRSQVINRGEQTIFLDAYNANPSSMKSAVNDYCSSLPEGAEPLMVVGDMNELGDLSARYHQELGELMKKLGVAKVCFVGRFAEYFVSGFGDGALVFKNVGELTSQWNELSRAANYIFIKGSRSLQLERLIDITEA